jgi:hypothetical protein
MPDLGKEMHALELAVEAELDGRFPERVAIRERQRLVDSLEPKKPATIRESIKSWIRGQWD